MIVSILNKSVVWVTVVAGFVPKSKRSTWLGCKMLLLDEGVLIEIKSNAEADYVG